MMEHKNYASMMQEWKALDTNFERTYKTWILEGSHEAETEAARKKKNWEQRQLKFVTALCNRVAHHVYQSE